MADGQCNNRIGVHRGARPGYSRTRRAMSPTHRHCRCGSPLARDNSDTLCTACQRKRRHDRAPDVPPDFWHTDMMGAALASGDIGRVIRAYRSHPFHGQILPQSTVADWLHVSQTTLSRIENGRRRLTIDDIDGFARALGLSVALRLVRQHPGKAGEDVDPFEVLEMGRVERSEIGPGTLEALHAAAEQLCCGYSTVPAPALREETEQQLGYVRRLLDGRRNGRGDATQCKPRPTPDAQISPAPCRRVAPPCAEIRNHTIDIVTVAGKPGRVLQLGRADHEPEPCGPTTQPRVKRDEAAAEDMSERDVIGVVGLGPAELVGHGPGSHWKRLGLHARNRRGQHALKHRFGLVAPELAPPHR